MTPTNSTEELLLHIANDNSLTKENKTTLINYTAYPDQYNNYAAGKACAVCPPPQARPVFVENLIRSLGIRYTVTIYAAHPGTPLNEDNGEPKFENGERVTSAAGHMWYEISDEKSKHAYGFAPIDSGIWGDGEVTPFDTIHYEKPRYSRIIEIKEEHYEQLKKYGDLARDKDNPDFDLYYVGTWNSCIDFTWKALGSAGLKPKINFYDSLHTAGRKILGHFEGSVKVDNNILDIKSITAPFPDSELNKEHYNKPPEKTPAQILLTRVDNGEEETEIS
ncbi:serine protease [Xenorhabdus beddingii]|uniref:Serine protease n=1 Tax=Xenorhabdus beddingii TaxID=40578 RepID=A0A1Y2SNQ9_9GAMM|nr:hypothetical protein [Xenorhabdus beddingii]OTA20636.1 serine protease [Xenorhabdus beddingii]